MTAKIIKLSQDVAAAQRQVEEAQQRLERAIHALLSRSEGGPYLSDLVHIPTTAAPEAPKAPKAPKAKAEKQDESTQARHSYTRPNGRNQTLPKWRGKNRDSRHRGSRGGPMERVYRSALYASVAGRLGVGTATTFHSASGNQHNGVWLTEEEHSTVSSLANEISTQYAKAKKKK